MLQSPGEIRFNPHAERDARAAAELRERNANGVRRWTFRRLLTRHYDSVGRADWMYHHPWAQDKRTDDERARFHLMWANRGVHPANLKDRRK